MQPNHLLQAAIYIANPPNPHLVISEPCQDSRQFEAICCGYKTHRCEYWTFGHIIMIILYDTAGIHCLAAVRGDECAINYLLYDADLGTYETLLGPATHRANIFWRK